MTSLIFEVQKRFVFSEASVHGTCNACVRGLWPSKIRSLLMASNFSECTSILSPLSSLSLFSICHETSTPFGVMIKSFLTHFKSFFWHIILPGRVAALLLSYTKIKNFNNKSFDYFLICRIYLHNSLSTGLSCSITKSLLHHQSHPVQSAFKNISNRMKET